MHVGVWYMKCLGPECLVVAGLERDGRPSSSMRMRRRIPSCSHVATSPGGQIRLLSFDQPLRTIEAKETYYRGKRALLQCCKGLLLSSSACLSVVPTAALPAPSLPLPLPRACWRKW